MQGKREERKQFIYERFATAYNRVKHALLDCGSEWRGFEPRRSPMIRRINVTMQKALRLDQPVL